MDWFIIVFTMLPPTVEPWMQEAKVWDETSCRAIIERVTPKFEATEGLIYSFDCESRRRPKEKEE